MTRVFALTARGLEAICADEIAALPGVTIEQVAYRRVTAACGAPLAPLLGLRTVDDVFLDVAAWPGITRQRSALDRLGEFGAQLDLSQAATHCAEVRQVPRSPVFSVTANFVGKRNYSTVEIKQACAETIAAVHGWAYAPDDAESDLNVRVFIDHDVAFVGVRLGERPLHRRPYKHAHVPGSLKPPVAAAMLALAEVGPGMRLLDPCCGAGTILIEAAQIGAVVQGGDCDPDAVTAARANLSAAGVSVDVREWDACALPLDDGAFERVVTNLPWGREVQIDAAFEAFYRRVCAEMRRVLAPGGRIAVLTSLPHLVNFPDLQQGVELEISLFGQTPTVQIFSRE
ncbi:MAG: methyltransferase domain-containing protein [Anaerolineae bacterium]